MLLLIPRIDLSRYVNLALAGLTLMAFVYLALRMHRRTKSDERGWRYYVLLAASSIPVFILSFFALQSYGLGTSYLTRTPYPLYNSTIRLQPDFGIYNVGAEQTMAIQVESGDEPINAAEATLTFDPSSVAVRELDTTKSDCSYVLENHVDAVMGTAHISCVLIAADPHQRTYHVADIVATPTRAGIFSFVFDGANTHVLANDGLGTDVLRFAQDSSYRADLFAPLGSTTASTTGRTFVVFSPTHPNESRWYNSPTVELVWIGQPGAVYRYAFDTNPNTTPSNEHTTQEVSANLALPGDGVYYFHLQLVRGGPIAHYRIQVDRTPPTVVRILSSSSAVHVGDVVRFSFDAQDSGSGIQRNYYVDVGGHLFLPVGKELYVPFEQAGDQKITLRVYDGAGNYTEKTQSISVSPK